MKLAFSGHRPEKIGGYDLDNPCSKWIKKEIIKQIDINKPSTLISGMALGVDTIVALLAIELDLELIAAIPFNGQEKIWPQKSKDLYNQILQYKKINKVIVCDGGYEPYKMQVRNKWMVDNCDKLIAVYDGTKGGTANCFNYAIKINKPTFVINPNDFNKMDLL